MLNILVKLKSTRKGRYLLVGGLVYLIELIIIVITRSTGASSVTSVTLSFWVGVVLSFALQKLVTFQDRRMHHKILGGQIIAVGALVLFNYGFTVGLVASLSAASPIITRTIALVITTVWNYYLYKTRIFHG